MRRRGTGSAPTRGDFRPPPHDSAGHTWNHADGLLYRIVATGVTDTTSRRPPRMPAFGATLSGAEIRAVLTYLETLWTPAPRRHQVEVSRDGPSDLYLLHPTRVPPFNTAIVHAYTVLAAAGVKRGGLEH